MHFPPTSQLASQVVSSVSPTRHSLPEIIWQNLQPWDIGLQPKYQHGLAPRKPMWLLDVGLIEGAWIVKPPYGDNHLLFKMLEAGYNIF